MQRIVAGIPLYGVDIRERDLPQETEQMRALNFNKGCYVGQEIVERIRSRGNVHRKFTGFVAGRRGGHHAGRQDRFGRKRSGRSHQRCASSLHLRRAHGCAGIHSTRGGSAGARGDDWRAKATVAQLPLESVAVGHAQDSVLHQRKVLNAKNAKVRRRTREQFHQILTRATRTDAMAEKRQESGFTVTDRRLFTEDGELRKEVREEVAVPKPAAATPDR